MIIADTGAIVALVDADEAHHQVLRSLYEQDPGAWLLPWAILPEVDYLLATRVGRNARNAFFADVADGVFTVEWGQQADLSRARSLHARHQALDLGLVDGVVMAVAERLEARAIATLDTRDFAAVPIKGRPQLLPRDSNPTT